MRDLDTRPERLLSAALRETRRETSGAIAYEPLVDASDRWRVLFATCIGVMLCLTTWFSATAVAPEIVATRGLESGHAGWLTNAVQLGFVTGALGASILNLPDLLPLRRIMCVAGLAAAAVNLLVLYASSFEGLLLVRFLNGVALALIYPPALKLISTWFLHGRGLALGAVIAALTLGSAAPHLLHGALGSVSWRFVVVSTSILTLCGTGLLVLCARDGPFPFAQAPFNPKQLRAAFSNRPLMLAHFGYLGHMWELYAMWAWFLSFARSTLPRFGYQGEAVVSLATFAVIAAGAVGALGGGILADRIGRTATTIAMMTISGSCALLIGFSAGASFYLFAAVSLVWGVSVIGDSAQFSAMATELSDERYVGTALSFQLGTGFALTMISIQLTPLFAALVGWRWSFLLLVPGPLLGTAAILLLRRMPAAERIAGGLK
jgi:MFS family permease